MSELLCEIKLCEQVGTSRFVVDFYSNLICLRFVMLFLKACSQLLFIRVDFSQKLKRKGLRLAKKINSRAEVKHFVFCDFCPYFGDLIFLIIL